MWVRVGYRFCFGGLFGKRVWMGAKMRPRKEGLRD